MGIAFFWFFSVTHKIGDFSPKIELSQRHGAPLLAENLGSQYSAPANQELGKQEKGFSSCRRLREGAASPHVAD
jgi:hypothetical protein